MTSISQSISFVRADVCARRHAARYAEGRARQGALTAYPTATPLVEAIERDRKRDYERSEPVAQALIEEYRHDRATLWSSLLIILCKPMLLNLRDEIAGEALPRDEVDQLVLASFIEAVNATAAAPSRAGQTFSQLRTMTRRAVMRAVTAAQREQTQTELVEPERLRELVDGERRSDRRLEHARTPAHDDDDEAAAKREESAQIAALKKYGADLLKGDLIDMLVHTVIKGGRLIDFVDAAHATSSEQERRQHYAREKRRHARAVALMRTVLAPLRRKKWAQPADGSEASMPLAGVAGGSGEADEPAPETLNTGGTSDRPAPIETDERSAMAERRERES